MSETAIVIDLDSFRRNRRARTARPNPGWPGMPVYLFPVLITWVPVWAFR